MPIRSPTAAAALAACLLAACALPAAVADVTVHVGALLPADALLVGEQHDASEHQQAQRRAVQWLAERGQLAALALEMAEQGRSTAGLAPTASEDAVRAALGWNDQAWPWSRYGPVAMAAVRAGVPVLGANLPRSAMRAAMQDAALDRQLDGAALARQQAAIRAGHCDLLPAAQIPAMARVQIARDQAMAQTVGAARRAGQTVLLVAGAGHVVRDLGVPRHLEPGLRAAVLLLSAGDPGPAQAAAADAVLRTAPLPPTDYCAGLRR